jgi:NAD-dependent dihydropyrimidine dehydrogenase PreA subunit
MSIEKIDLKLCNGCGTCVDSCPFDVIRMDEKEEKAVIKYPAECRVCGLCELDCPTDAIYVGPEQYVQYPTSWGV